MLRKHRALFAGLALLSAVTSADAAVVISQVYGGGGGTNAATSYKNDYIELFNSGTTAVTLSSYSIQYGSSGGTGAWSVHNLPALTIQPGAYALIQEGGGTVGATLPTPDATGGLNLSATAGKVALVSNTTALNGACPTAGVVDVVGWVDSPDPTRDASGRIINDPWATPYETSGFDLDAVAVLNAIPEPGSCGLLFTGALLLASRRRARG